jgi:hypothetical protein
MIKAGSEKKAQSRAGLDPKKYEGKRDKVETGCS